jgi:Asp-tRNA(Asn)/Glu-tRNA(Gln) amidotransferase A subunit family amidase
MLFRPHVVHPSIISTTYRITTDSTDSTTFRSGSKKEGLPLSLQIAAAPFAEGLVLRIAHAYQEATDWHRRHPSLA